MMKKAKFLTVFLTSAILLSGCKASETSENSDAVSVSTSTSETSTESSVVSSAVSSVESASSDVSTTISSSSTVISSVESTSTAPTETTTSEPTSETSIPTETSEPAPEWTETPTSGTMYVNMSCFSRAKAVLGAEKVKQYFLNDAVTVTARATSASTGDIYYKIAEGEFIHSDYLSSSKIVIQQPATPSGNESQQSQQPTTPSSSNNNQPSSSGTPKVGDTKVVDGVTYTYAPSGRWIKGTLGHAVQEPDIHEYNPADDYIDPNCH